MRHETQFRKFFYFRHLNIDKTQNFNYNYNEDRGKDPSLIWSIKKGEYYDSKTVQKH